MGDIPRSFLGQDRQLAAFFFYSGDISVANNKSMASIVNASGSGKIVVVRKIKLINTQISSATGTILEFELKRITGHTGGTDITVEKADTQDVLPTQVTNKIGATVSGESTSVFMSWHLSSDDWGSGTLDVEALSTALNTALPVYLASPETKAIVLREVEGITIKCVTNSTVGTFEIMIEYTVE